MQRGWVIVGLLCHAMAASLFGLGYHDGLLASTPMAELPAPHSAPAPATVRIKVDGNSDEAKLALTLLQEQYRFGPDFGPWIQEDLFFLARFDPPAENTFVFLKWDEAKPPPTVGEILVVEGVVKTFQPQFFGGDPFTPPYVVILDPASHRSALVFKDF